MGVARRDAGPATVGQGGLAGHHVAVGGTTLIGVALTEMRPSNEVKFRIQVESSTGSDECGSRLIAVEASSALAGAWYRFERV